MTLTDSTAFLLGSVESKVSFLGSAFAFRKRFRFLTAAHCVGNLPASALFLGAAGLKNGTPVSVSRIVRHPTADIALLEIAEDTPTRMQPLGILAKSSVVLGADIMAMGFQEASDERGVQVTRRLFRGSIQRFFNHQSHIGYAYEAAELSFPSPAGLSGGPVVTSHAAIHVVGLVTENFESTTFLQTLSLIQDQGSVYEEKVHKVIQCGICCTFDSLEPWIIANIGHEF